MYENYRMPGEFEKRSNVYVTWLPDYIRAEGYDNRQPCVDVIKALLEYGDVTVNLNCGTPGSYEEACSRLKEEGVDLDRIEITQFEDSNFYVRDNGPSIMVDDKAILIWSTPLGLITACGTRTPRSASPHVRQPFTWRLRSVASISSIPKWFRRAATASLTVTAL